MSIVRPLLVMLLLTSAVQAAARPPERPDLAAADRRASGAFRACRPAMAEMPVHRNSDPHRDLLLMLGAMLNAPADACPGAAAEAMAYLAIASGDPIRADADLALLVMRESALRDGKGGSPDPVTANEIARHLWLVGGDREVPGMTAGALEQWLEGADAVASLEARIKAAPTGRAVWLRAGQLLDRDRPDYDPARAAHLLERVSPDRYQETVRLKLAALLSDGVHLPPDFPRAAKTFRDQATGIGNPALGQRILLKIGRRAAAAARTPADRLAALAILAPAALDSLEDSEALYRRELGKVKARRIDTALPDRVLEWTRAETRFAFAYLLDMLPETVAPSDRPIVYEGMIGPDGRLVTVRLLESSGVPARDRAVKAAWLSHGPRIDFSAVAPGRTFWIRLPAVHPMFDYGAAYDEVKAACPFCM
jgi:hypothetical protein